MTRYRGRFAPSPTGPLHFGSLVAALGSCLEARAHGGEWLVRIEDVDAPRCRHDPGELLATLERLGFAWEGEVLVQSRRHARYAELLESLKTRDLAYPCACTRRELADSALASDGAALYPGTCRNGLPPGKAARAWRLRVDDSVIDFTDGVQGPQRQALALSTGDFVLLRADGYFAYQLAVVADDADQGITHVVRGADLIDSTPRQIHLQRCLGLPTPAYAHLPVAVNAAGEKLSKQSGAVALDPAQAPSLLAAALDFLGHPPPAELRRAAPAALWEWAGARWQLARVPAVMSQPLPATPDNPARRSG
jgi:glutamyl-Q tRNA(Asp) synthetase